MPAWSAVLDGVNNRATFPAVTTSNNVDIETVITFNSLAGGAVLSDTAVGNYFRYNAGSLRFRCIGFLGNSMPFTPTIGQKYTLRVELRPTGAELFVDGVSVGSGGGGTPTGMLITTVGFFNSTYYLNVIIERLTVTDNTTPANSIDLYNDVAAGSNTNWKDQTVNGRDATLINTPIDGSQWLEAGGGDGLTIIPTGIPSEETFGTTTAINLTQILGVGSISSLEAVSTPTINVGSVVLEPAGIPSQEAFGAPSILYNQVIAVDAITSEETFGTVIVWDGVIIVIPYKLPQETITPVINSIIAPIFSI